MLITKIDAKGEFLLLRGMYSLRHTIAPIVYSHFDCFLIELPYGTKFYRPRDLVSLLSDSVAYLILVVSISGLSAVWKLGVSLALAVHLFFS